MSSINSGIGISALKQNVVDNDVILAYLKNTGIIWVSIPTPFDTWEFDFAVHVSFQVGFLDLDYGDASGNNFEISVGDLETLKVVIIENT